MSNENSIDAIACLQTIVSYIRGDESLDSAISKLEFIGLDTSSAKKVLYDTPRDNVIKFKKKI